MVRQTLHPNPQIEKSGGVVHAIATCLNCDWTATWYLTAENEGAEHSKLTKHTVDVEVGMSYRYSPI